MDGISNSESIATGRINVQVILKRLNSSSSNSDRFAALLIIYRATDPSAYSPSDFASIFAAIGNNFMLRLATSGITLYIDMSLNLLSLSLAACSLTSTENTNDLFICRQIHSTLISPTVTGALFCMSSDSLSEEHFCQLLDSLTTLLTSISVSEVDRDISIPLEILEKLIKIAETAGRPLSTHRRLLEVLFMLFTTLKHPHLTDKLLILMISSISNDTFDYLYALRLVSILPKLLFSGPVSSSVVDHILSVISSPLKTKCLEGQHIASVFRLIHCTSTCLMSYDNVDWLFTKDPSLGVLTFRRMAIEFNILAVSEKLESAENNYLVDLYRLFIFYMCSGTLDDGSLISMLNSVQDSMMLLFDSIELTMEQKTSCFGIWSHQGCLSARFKLFFAYLAEDCSILKIKGLLTTFKFLISAFCAEYKSFSDFCDEALFDTIGLFNNVLFPGLFNAIKDADFADIIVESGIVSVLLECFVKAGKFVKQFDKEDLDDFVKGVSDLVDDGTLENMVLSQTYFSSDLMAEIEEVTHTFKSLTVGSSVCDLLNRIVKHYPPPM